MSLVGSLEDLGLADILQIVSLSRKSGMLALRSEGGDGRIVLRDGLVQGAAIKGEPGNLRSLLVGGGFVDGESFDRAREVVVSGELSLEEAVERECELPAQQLESLRREHVERAVLRMFSWRSGEFSFEIGEELSSQEEEELLLPTGLNTQYLAMEATRQRDENVRTSDDAEVDAEPEEPVFSGEEPVAEAASQADEAEPLAVPAVEVVEASDDSAAVDALAFAVARNAEEEEAVVPEAEPLELTPSGDVEVDAAGPVEDTRVPVSVAAESAPRSPGRKKTPPGRQGGTLVAIDPNLSALEWLKGSVNDLFRRVHIFQRTEIAIDRIRQYLMRGVIPHVVVADRAGEELGAQAFVRRLRSLAPTMPVLALRPEGADEGLDPELDGVLFRPASPSSDPDRWHLHAAQAGRLREELGAWLSGARSDGARRRARNALGRLKHVSDRLRDPSTQGEVLTVVLEFAAETFSRVAMFMLRDDVAAGIAQLGLPPTGGPDDEGMRAIEFTADEMPELFGRVLEKRTAVRSALGGPRDHQLSMRLGAAAPAEAYAAPIESGGCVVALVYADNLPEERPIRDTTALEIVLHEAGLALDRALLERALAERD